MAIDFDKYIHSTGTHYISNSGKDENSGTKGGRAGDQTGHEWELKKWYNRPWTVVLRYPDQAVALTIAQLSIAAALNNLIGYDQSQRTTYWTQLAAAGYDPSKITVACEEDCTAGVSANVRAAGCIHSLAALKNLPICTSRNMRAQFTKAGFIALTDSKYLTGPKHLLPGDVLLYESHHAAANVTVGEKVRDQWFPENTPTPPAAAAAPCVLIGGNVNVRCGPDTGYAAMGVAKAGERLRYFGFTGAGGWHLVEYDRRTGWVSGKYGEVVGA